MIATTDSGTNVKKALDISEEFVHVPCFAHKMHRVMVCAIGKVAWLETALSKIVAIARNMAKSDKQQGAYMRFMRTELGKIGLLPVSPVKTRWNSFGDAIERYLVLHDDLRTYAASRAAEEA